MQPYYRISLKKNITTWWGIAGELAQTQIQPYYLSEAFDEWQKTEIIDERNLRMFGFHRNYSEDMYTFVLEGAKIIRHILFTEGPNAKASLYIETFNDNTRSYELEYEADINFNSAINKRDSISVNVIERGIAGKIKNREDLVYEITPNKLVNIRPVLVNGRIRFLTAWPIPAQGDTFTDIINATRFRIYAIGVDRAVVKVADNETNETVYFSDPEKNNGIVGQRYVDGNPLAFLGYNHLFRTNTALKNVKVSAEIPFHVNNHTGTDGRFNGQLHLIWIKDDTTFAYGAYVNPGGGSSSPLYKIESAVIPDGTDANFTLKFEPPPFDMPEGTALVMEFDQEFSVFDDFDVTWEKDHYIKVDFQHYTTAFEAKGITLYDLGKELIKQITDDEATFASGLLSTSNNFFSGYDLKYKDVLMLSGDCIRGLANAKIKISLKDYLKSLFVITTAGLGIEGDTVRIERVDYFFKTGATNEIADLGGVPDCDIQVAKEFIFNELRIGFMPQEYDDVNGKDVVHTTHIYRLPQDSEKNVLEMVSPVRADGIGIIKTYTDYVFEENKDSKEDNSLFFLQVKDTLVSGVYQALFPEDIIPNGIVGNAVLGVTNPEDLLNAGLTPKKCLYRAGRYLRSLFYGQDTSFIIFQSADRNKDLKTWLGAPIQVVESGNVQLNKLGSRLFYPFTLSTSCEAPLLYKNSMGARSNGYFSFTWLGVKRYGFAMKTYGRNAKPRIHIYNLLATPDNDIPGWE